MESNQHLRLFRPALYRISQVHVFALSRDSAASGFRSRDFPRDKRTLYLSELWRRDELQIVKELLLRHCISYN